MDLSAEPVGNDLLILDKRNNRIHRLNQTACAVWRSVELGIGTDGIVEGLVEKFDVSRETVLTDVLGILNEFRALNLLNAAGTERQ
jgi:Coenzyme PQQ synthesis protein D (PqqD)